MRRLVPFVLVPLLATSCKKSKEDTCDQLAKMGTAFANELGKRVGGESDLGESGEIKAQMAELKAQCMTWPDEVFDCMRDNDETSPKCREAIQHVTGLVATDVLKAPPGPAIAATANIGETTWDGLPISLQHDGTVIAAIADGIVSYAPTGKPNWRVVMDHDRWMLVEGDLVLTGHEHDVVALDLATGETKWRAPTPQIDEYSHATTEGGVRVGAAAYMPLDDGRVLRVNPAACAKEPQTGCLELAFTFEDEEFDNPHLFALGDDIVFVESNAIRRISTRGEVRGHIHVRDDLGGATPAGDQRVAAIFDDELVMIDFAKCTGATAIELPRKKGRMYLRGEGECDDCRLPPKGCVVRAPIDDVDSMPPTVLPDGLVLASNWDGPVAVTPGGAKVWASEVDSIGTLRGAGDNIVFFSRDDEEKPVRIAALDRATGKAAWSTPVVGWKSKDISSLDTTVETNDSWIVVGNKGRLAWLKVR
ncbi:MAG: PQQ-binding-like beta-propeller repeat protein [Kofleriaceae bacterium]